MCIKIQQQKLKGKVCSINSKYHTLTAPNSKNFQKVP